MREAPAPTMHLFVCANRRPDGAPLGPGCGDAGEAIYAIFKDEVARRGEFAAVWITKTACLGVCPKTGATVAVYPWGRVVSEVLPAEASALYDRERRRGAS